MDLELPQSHSLALRLTHRNDGKIAKKFGILIIVIYNMVKVVEGKCPNDQEMYYIVELPLDHLKDRSHFAYGSLLAYRRKFRSSL